MTEYLPNFKEIMDSTNSKTLFSLTVIITAVFLIVLMSATISASIAEKKSHPRIIHAILGGIIPLFYPCFIAVTLKSTKAVSSASQQSSPSQTYEELPSDDFNSAYFKSIYLDEEGNHRGPFLIDMAGNMIKAITIEEVQKEFIVVETSTVTGTSQRIRIPYSKITSCNEA